MYGMKRRVAFWAVSFSALGGTFNGVVKFQRSICGDTYGSIQAQAKGHTWQEAACTQPKSCASAAQTHCGADWTNEAIERAKRCLYIMPMPRERPKGQLECEKFTNDQLEEARKAVGY